MEYYFTSKLMENNINKNKIMSYSKPFSNATSQSTFHKSTYMLSTPKNSSFKSSLCIPLNKEQQPRNQIKAKSISLFSQTQPSFKWKDYFEEKSATQYQKYRKKNKQSELQFSNLMNNISNEEEGRDMQQSLYGVVIKHNQIPFIKTPNNIQNKTTNSQIQESELRAFDNNFPSFQQPKKKTKKIELLLSSSTKKRPTKLIPTTTKKQRSENKIQLNRLSLDTIQRDEPQKINKVFQKSYWEQEKLNEYMQYIPENLQDDSEETLMKKYFNLDFQNQKLDTRQLQFDRNKKKFLFFQMLIKEVILDIQEKIMQKTNQSKDQSSQEGAIMLNPNFISELSQLLNCIKQAISELNTIQPLVSSQNEANRSQMDLLLQTILTLLQKQKLPTVCLTLYIIKLQAKLNFYSKDHIKAIMLFRDCKALAEKYLASLNVNKFLLKCYKGLGKCFQEYNKYSSALHYLFRALQLSWSISDIDQELQTYELISRQYFYNSELTLSKFYHLKMTYGEAESKDSSIRQLGVARIKNREKKLLDPQFQVQRRMQIWKYRNEEDVLQISSDEEEKFEMPMQLKERIDINDIMNQKKNSITNNNNKKQKRSEQVLTQALVNKQLYAPELLNRKIGIVNRRKTDNYFKQLLGPKVAAHQIKGSRNEAIRLTHLSPNRFLMNYHKLKPEITNLKNYNIDEYMHGQLDQDVIKKLNSLFYKFKDNLQFVAHKFENIIKKGKQLEIFEKLEKSQQAQEQELLKNANKQNNLKQSK